MVITQWIVLEFGGQRKNPSDRPPESGPGPRQGPGLVPITETANTETGNLIHSNCLSEATWDPDWKRLAHFSIHINLAHLEAVNQPETAVGGGEGGGRASKV